MLPSTGRGQRLNNHAAILRSKNVMGRESSPAEESTPIASGAGGAVVEAASQRVTRLGGVLARRRPPSASPSNRRMPEPNIGDRNSYGSCVHVFRTAKLRRGSRTFAHDQARRGWSKIITIFQWVLIFEQSVNRRRGPRWWPRIGAAIAASPRPLPEISRRAD
jgi:hypothetical protein